MKVALGVVFGVLLLLLLMTVYCFVRTFYAKKAKPLSDGEYDLPKESIYKPFYADMIRWQQEMRRLPCEDCLIRSFDNLSLHARYYECKKGAPIEIMFHGYRGNAERDLCGGVYRAFACGHNVLLVDQRTSGKSEGRVISFGINEHKDCLAWIDFAIGRFGQDVKLMLTGVSMGAATVLMASGYDLPKNVVYILADCGYDSPKEIIQKTVREMHLPVGLVYPIIRLSARLFGRFDLEEFSPIAAVEKSRTPILFFHGESDDFVPCAMSESVFAACKSKKELILVPNAGHGLAFCVNQQAYIDALLKFECSVINETDAV